MMERLSLALLLCCFMHLILEASSFLFDLPSKDAKVKPRDKLLFIGESLRFDCVMEASSKYIIDYDVGFTMENKFESEKLLNVSTFPMGIGLNGVSAWIDFDKDFLLKDCVVTHLSCRDLNNEKAFTTDYANFFVEYPPQNVTNITTIWYGNDIIVSWLPAFDYLCRDKEVQRVIDVVVEWRVSAGQYFDCDKECSKENQCTFKNLGANQYNIRINVTLRDTKIKERPDDNILRSNFPRWASQEMTIITAEHYKPQVPEEFKVLWANSTCMGLTWRGIIPSDKGIYHLDVTDVQSDSHFVKQGNYSIVAGSNNMANVIVCGIKPYTKYEFKLRTKQRVKGYFSDFSTELKYTTEEEVPEIGPYLTQTSFHDFGCTDSTDGRSRKIRLYWNPVPREDVKGNLLHYEVVFKTRTSDKTTVKINGELNFFEGDIPCDESATFTISAVNGKGKSITPTVITLPSHSRALSVPEGLDFRVEEKESEKNLKDFSIRWNPKAVKDMNLFLYYCEEGNSRTCFTDIQSKKSRTSTGVIDLVEIPRSYNLFGYALKDDRTRRVKGIDWTECIYINKTTQSALNKKIRLLVSAGSDDLSVDVTWFNSPCSRVDKSRVVSYQLFLCPHQRKPDQKDSNCYKVVKQASDTSHTWRYLDPRVEMYRAYIQALYTGGLGELSYPAPALPRHAFPDPFGFGSFPGFRLATNCMCKLHFSVSFVAVFLFFSCFWFCF